MLLKCWSDANPCVTSAQTHHQAFVLHCRFDLEQRSKYRCSHNGRRHFVNVKLRKAAAIYKPSKNIIIKAVWCDHVIVVAVKEVSQRLTCLVAIIVFVLP